MSMQAPEAESVARSWGPLPQETALRYASLLPPDRQATKTGCYVVRCVRCCGLFNDGGSLPVACLYNLSCCDSCLWPGIGTIPFGCFIWFIKTNASSSSHYINLKRDELLIKVDEQKETLACYAKDCGSPCCYCEREC
uniref:Uncharacterized protein n=1 Tax=Attheya septentrionalis TaxID=420275 RepID=A0A7S2UB21_9STRA|mmetsp:Transcript_18040/g.32709  ORF Transcript_18040/g.32709 Transcript_18040/m.32709 type:complete len:138 (+) Transcript_18040:90-503(+)